MLRIPTCSPSGPMTRTDGIRMRSLTRISLLVAIGYPPLPGATVVKGQEGTAERRTG